MTTLLNPAWDTCYDCECTYCSDYSGDPAWCVSFHNVQAINTGYANRVTHNGVCYYWEDNSLATKINDLLVKLSGLFLVSTSGTTRTYRSGKISLPDLDMDIKIYSSANCSDPEGSFVARTMKFSSMFTQLFVYDDCGTRYVRGIISGLVRSGYGELNPQDYSHNPPSDSTPIWAAYHEYSEADPGVACGEMLTGDKGESTNFVQSLFSADYPPLLGPGPGVKIKAQTSNPLLPCDQKCPLVDTVTINSSEACLAPFVGTWTTASALPPTECGYECRTRLTSSLPSGSCTVGGVTYDADTLIVECYGNKDGTMAIVLTFSWVDSSSTTRYLTGRFLSTDYGTTFSAWEIDEVAGDCIVIYLSDGPTTGSDLTCSVTLR